MTLSTLPLVLDSWALLAYYQNEPAAPTVEALIDRSLAVGMNPEITLVNFGEVWCNTAQRSSAAQADQLHLKTLTWGIRIVAEDWTLTREAARFKALYRISYADGFAAALAKLRGAELASGDLEFRQVEHEVKIHWLKR